MRNSAKFTTYDIIVVGVMAAVIFAATAFLKIGPIPTPSGPTQLKMANALCLLGAILFGGLRGGLAAGIGSMFYDLSDPAFVSSAPFTLVFFFIMAYLCGVVSHSGQSNGKSNLRNLLGAVTGSVTYFLLFIAKSILTLMLAGSDFTAAFVGTSVKFLTSAINMPFSIVVAVLLAPVCRKALTRAGFERKLFGKPASRET